MKPDNDIPPSSPHRHVHAGMHYLNFLEQYALQRKIDTYFEIGVNLGKSLSKINARCIGVDPQFVLRGDVVGKKPELFLFQTTSDEFFRSHRIMDYFADGLDLAFLDGMHLFEYLLRDFMHVERSMKRDGLVYMHDCLPINAEMTERERSPATRVDTEFKSHWTGDVWKLVPILKEHRPDLEIQLIDCVPTGLVSIRNFDPKSDVLAERYDDIVSKYSQITMDETSLVEFYGRFPTRSAESMLDQLTGRLQ